MYANTTHNPFVLASYTSGISVCYRHSFRLVAPPPNITGELHVGHLLNFVLQRVFGTELENRGKRLQRVVGMDHAGIAVKHVLTTKYGCSSCSRFWAWKRRIGQRVLLEIKRALGLQLLQNVRFTLDKPFSVAVAWAFVKLHRANVAVSRLRLLCWDSTLCTTVSKLETEAKIEWKHELMWKFVLVVGSSLSWCRERSMWTATNYLLATRVSAALETRLLIVDINGLSLCKLASASVIDPVSGSVMKLVATAEAFDVNRCADATGWVRASSAVVLSSVLGLSTGLVGEAYIKALACVNVLTSLCVRYGLRTGCGVGHRLANQWFVRLRSLLSCCEALRIRIEPSKWRLVFAAWASSLRLWCVSRSMSWGHTLPIWRLGASASVRDSRLKSFYYLVLCEAAPFGCAGALTQRIRADALVFDTWFSSALWCLSCLGWPNKTAQLRSACDIGMVLTGFDIIFFWVVKMALVSCFLVRQRLPFGVVLVHPVVCDGLGRKMSKTKNNAVSPKALFNSFGLDTVRLYFSSVCLDNQQFKMCLNTLVSCRNVCTKFWNIGLASSRARDDGLHRICGHWACRWAVTSVFIRTKRVEQALRAFNTSCYMREFFNLVKYDLSNHNTLVGGECGLAYTLCQLVWRCYRGVIFRCWNRAGANTCYVGAYASVVALLRLLAVVFPSDTVCSNCVRAFRQSLKPAVLLARVNFVYFDKLRLSERLRIGLWCNGLVGWF